MEREMKMNLNKSVVAMLLVMSLGACEIEPDYVNSGFATPNSSGGFSEGLSNPRSGTDSDASGNGYAYQVGFDGGDGFRAVAGVLPGTTVGGAVTSGTVTYTGDYELVRVTGINVSGGLISGTPSFDSGTISLEADFGSGTLTGGDGSLTVDGTINGRDLGGSVAYNGLGGRLDGEIGSARAVGVFHGNNDSTVYSGGFLVTP